MNSRPLACPAWDKTKELILQVVNNSCDDSVEYPVSLTEARVNILQNEMNFHKNKTLPVWTAVPSIALPLQIK